MRPMIPALLAMALLSPLPLAAQERASEADVIAASRAAYGAGCYAMTEEAAASGAYTEPPLRYEVTVPDEYGGEPHPFVIWQVFCDAGAYNLMHVYWIEGDYIGLRPLAFAKPVFETVLERPDDPESPVKDVVLVSWAATQVLVNSAFDPATMTFTHYGKFRGLGDAFDAGTWVLAFEEARLISYEVDASYDGEINPVSLFSAE